MPTRKNFRKVKRHPASISAFNQAQKVSPRMAIGNTLMRLALKYPEMTVLDGDVQNSTYTQGFARTSPARFIEVFIAEQNMVGIANGLAARGKIPIAATFGAFLTRAHDQLRMAQYAQTHQIYIGTHPGVAIGQDGASQMALDDIAMFRALQRSVVLYPSDAMSAARMMELALRSSGINYIRATRADLPHLYTARSPFQIGGSHTLLAHKKDQATIVAAGVTVFEALKAAEILSKLRVKVRVIDAYSIKPIDVETLELAAAETGRIVVVEDHVQEGGLADAVRSALQNRPVSTISLAVGKIPRSGRPEQLLRYEGIDSSGIVRAVQRIIKQ